MITQCSIRHLFAIPTGSTDLNTPSISQADKTSMLDISRSFILRRCNHHTLPEPLSTLECYRSFVDPNEQGTNKHRYILAAQDDTVRSWARGVRGVPVIYVKRSVMVMEPMAHASIGVREREEKGKLRAGVKKITGNTGVLGKRKREEENGDEDDNAESTQIKKKKKAYGAKGPNPLSIKKKKARPNEGSTNKTADTSITDDRPKASAGAGNTTADDVKKKRSKKHEIHDAAEHKAADSIRAHHVSIETG